MKLSIGIITFGCLAALVLMLVSSHTGATADDGTTDSSAKIGRHIKVEGTGKARSDVTVLAPIGGARVNGIVSASSDKDSPILYRIDPPTPAGSQSLGPNGGVLSVALRDGQRLVLKSEHGFTWKVHVVLK